MTPNKKYTIPAENALPDGHYCFPVYIPAEGAYLERFFWALDFFSKWVAWEETGDNMAQAVADRWKVANALTRTSFNEGGCSAVPQFRINPETCLIEVNCSDDPEAPDWKTIITQLTDPRTDITYPPPYPDAPPEGQTNQCLAAANIAEYVWFAGGKFALQINDGGLFAEFIALVMSVFVALFTLLTDIVIDATTTLFIDIDPETIGGDWTALDKQEFIDLLVCYLNEDGSFPLATWGDFLSALLAKVPDNPAWELVHFVCVLMGVGGMNIAGRIGGITDAECAECGAWEAIFNAENGWTGWAGFTGRGAFSPAPAATLIAGEWHAVTDGDYRELTIISPDVGFEPAYTEIRVVYTVENNAAGYGALWKADAGAEVSEWFTMSRVEGEQENGAFVGSSAEQMTIVFQIGGNTGTLKISEVRLYGTGENPYD